MNSFADESRKLIESFENCDTTENSRYWCEKMLNELFLKYVSLGICKDRTEYGIISYEVVSFHGKFITYECD